MKNALQITPAEFQILEVLWRSSKALSVGEVLESLRRRRELAYTTVMTLLDKLARKGSVTRNRKGKAYLYRPAVQREDVLDWMVQEFADNYCGGERAQLARVAREGSRAAPRPASKPKAKSRVPQAPPTVAAPDTDLDIVLL